MSSHAYPAERFVARPPGTEQPAVPAMRRLGSAEELENFGQLAGLVGEASVTDIFVNGAEEVWADRGGGLVRQPALDLDESGLRELAVRLIALGGRHIDETTPCVDVRLSNGLRVHVVLPPISTTGTLLSIRLQSVGRLGLAELDAAGFFSAVPLATVETLVAARENLLITGAGGSGKTTFLAALLSSASAADRIIAIEDVAEAKLSIPATR